MSTSVYGVASSESQADAAVKSLKAAGFNTEDISVLFPDKQQASSHDKDSMAPEGAVTGGATGVVVGGALGWMAGIGALVIPGVGPFIAAGPIVAALSGLALGAAVGSLTGSLIGLGIPESDAKKYETRIREGGILISTHTGNDQNRDRATKVMRKAGLEEVGASGMADPTAATPQAALVEAEAKAQAKDPVRTGTQAKAKAKGTSTSQAVSQRARGA